MHKVNIFRMKQSAWDFPIPFEVFLNMKKFTQL